MMDLEQIKRELNFNKERFLDDTYEVAFEDLNVFINYVITLNRNIEYKSRGDRILIIYNDVEWLRDIDIEVTNIVEDDFVQYSQFKLNEKFTVKVEADGWLIPLSPKPQSGIEKRQEWDEKMEICQSYLINLQNMRDEIIEYCIRRKKEILQERINEFGSIEVYESIMNYKKKIEAIDIKVQDIENEIEEIEIIMDDKEIEDLEQQISKLLEQKRKLNKYIDIALENKISIEDVKKRTFNSYNLKNRKEALDKLFE